MDTTPRRPAPRRPHPHPYKPAPAAAPAEDMLEPGESLQEAEAEIGINEWIDAESGEPPQGQSPPHLEAE
jgi:hypothetical protein